MRCNCEEKTINARICLSLLPNFAQTVKCKIYKGKEFLLMC